MFDWHNFSITEDLIVRRQSPKRNVVSVRRPIIRPNEEHDFLEGKVETRVQVSRRQVHVMSIKILVASSIHGKRQREYQYVVA